MRRVIREQLENMALWLAVVVLILAGVLLFITTPRTEPLEESEPFYIYHVVGGVEEDTAHLITREVAHDQ